MEREYRAAARPRWIWIMLAVVAVLIIMMALSVASTRRQREVIVIGPEVRTGDPRDYTQRPPATTPATPATPTAPAAPTPVPTEPTPPPAPPGGITPSTLPRSFTYDGNTYTRSGSPAQVDVLTTGHLTPGNHVIYRRADDRPPYEELYIETAPNSGRFYKYVPASVGNN